MKMRRLRGARPAFRKEHLRLRNAALQHGMLNEHRILRLARSNGRGGTVVHRECTGEFPRTRIAGLLLIRLDELVCALHGGVLGEDRPAEQFVFRVCP